jgi:hypothetical protein
MRHLDNREHTTARKIAQNLAAFKGDGGTDRAEKKLDEMVQKGQLVSSERDAPNGVKVKYYSLPRVPVELTADSENDVDWDGFDVDWDGEEEKYRGYFTTAPKPKEKPRNVDAPARVNEKPKLMATPEEREKALEASRALAAETVTEGDDNFEPIDKDEFLRDIGVVDGEFVPDCSDDPLIPASTPPPVPKQDDPAQVGGRRRPEREEPQYDPEEIAAGRKEIDDMVRSLNEDRPHAANTRSSKSRRRSRRQPQSNNDIPE